jgi:hypothetical protein
MRFLGQHRSPSRRLPTSSTTWVGYPEGANSDIGFGSMTRSGSSSLHAILKESPGEDDSNSSEGEGSGSPLLRVCNTMIADTPLTTMPPLEETSMFQTVPMRSQ